jgi:hypothetical protein
LLVLTLLWSLAYTTKVRAQSADELSEARAAFQRGIELEQAKNWTGALKMFREVGQVRMTPQVRYHIALCEEKLGKLVAALGGYELALADAESVGDGVSFKQEVEASITDLRARIPKVVIDRGKGAEAAAIELDGVALGESSVGVEVPLDPGPHSLMATAPGYADYSETLEVAEEETRTVSINLKPLPSDADSLAGTTGPDDTGTPDESGKKYGFYPYVLMGAGGATMATAGVLYFVVRASDLSQLKEHCERIDSDSYQCNDVSEDQRPELRKRSNRVDTLNYVSPILLGVGVAAAGVGATLFYLDLQNAKQAASKPGMRVAIAAPGADLGGISLAGSF